MTLLSILDLSPIAEGADAADALRRSIALARHADALHYTRFWVAEHHNMDGVASSATAVLVGQLAAATQRIRVGSGGIMLPNHAPLVVAEQFGTLDALFPGRIDLGLGRAPGTDRPTMLALRRHLASAAEDDFPRDVQELLAYLGPARADAPVRAIPGTGSGVPVWLLGSSLYSAQLAAFLGLPFAFASHFAPDLLDQACGIYLATYRPSAANPRPHLAVAANAIVADTHDEALRLFTSLQLRFLGMQRGQRGPLPRPIEPAELARLWSPQEEAGVRRMLAASSVGTADEVREGLQALAARTGAHEIIVAGATHSAAARMHGLTLLDAAWQRVAEPVQA